MSLPPGPVFTKRFPGESPGFCPVPYSQSKSPGFSLGGFPRGKPVFSKRARHCKNGPRVNFLFTKINFPGESQASFSLGRGGVFRRTLIRRPAAKKWYSCCFRLKVCTLVKLCLCLIFTTFQRILKAITTFILLDLFKGRPLEKAGDSPGEFSYSRTFP